VTTPRPDPAEAPSWSRVAVVRGIILLVTGTIALFRPANAGLVLGFALVAVSLLELTLPASGGPTAVARRRQRMLRIGAGVLAGAGLMASSAGGVTTEARVIAVALAVVGGLDLYGAWHATLPGDRGVRVGRAVLALTTAVVLFAIPTDALSIVTFVAAIGWVVVGLVSIVGVLFPPAAIRARGRGPTGIMDIVRAWLDGSDIGSPRRHEILDAYDYGLDDVAKLGRFAILLILAGVIASGGLISNSVASIIGAMIIAPLMGPIVGVALGIVTAMPARTIRCLVVATVGTIGTILIGVAMAAWLAGPQVAQNSEIVSRTSPTLIDLVVALAAGAAGAYAASNAKVADSLPGVAIAISLVPPLETAGILLALGEPASAGGALLLFVTNFVSIVLAASVVFVLTGVAPLARLLSNARETQGWFVSFVVAGLLLLIPLAIGGQQAFMATTSQTRASEAVDAWLAPAPDFVVVDVSVSGEDVAVAVAGPGDPPDPAELQVLLDRALGGPVQVKLRVARTTVFTTPTRASPSPAP
jgi:uncharacterized hydrophobic protein (TIGR00271 family)